MNPSSPVVTRMLPSERRGEGGAVAGGGAGSDGVVCASDTFSGVISPERIVTFDEKVCRPGERISTR